MKSNSNYLFNLLIVFISIISSINLYSSSDEVVNPPNILLIICDDLNTDIEGWGGHPQTITPNISRLMDGAINFKQAHCTIPICALHVQAFSPEYIPIILIILLLTNGKKIQPSVSPNRSRDILKITDILH